LHLLINLKMAIATNVAPCAVKFGTDLNPSGHTLPAALHHGYGSFTFGPHE
jgi:hypothetical protein